MVDFAPLLKVMPIFAVALISPGPDFMLVSTMALSRGRFAGILGAAGIATGSLIYIVLCMFGMGFVFAKMHWLVTFIRIAGGLYLVYLGIHLWKASLGKRNEQIQVITSRKGRNPFMAGFLTNITNPKALAFFTSVFALTLSPDTGLPTQALTIAGMFAMAFTWFGIVALGLSTPAVRQVYTRWSRWIDRLSGTFLTFFGLRLMFSEK
jgi:RhtB (resistance to homoserine/threonine) family protein